MPGSATSRTSGNIPLPFDQQTCTALYFFTIWYKCSKLHYALNSIGERSCFACRYWHFEPRVLQACKNSCWWVILFSKSFIEYWVWVWCGILWDASLLVSLSLHWNLGRRWAACLQFIVQPHIKDSVIVYFSLGPRVSHNHRISQ